MPSGVEVSRRPTERNVAGKATFADAVDGRWEMQAIAQRCSARVSGRLLRAACGNACHGTRRTQRGRGQEMPTASYDRQNQTKHVASGETASSAVA
jgi:hypothetical protein